MVWICYTWENRKKLMDKTSLNPREIHPDEFSYWTVVGAQLHFVRNYAGSKFEKIGFQIESCGFRNFAHGKYIDTPLNVVDTTINNATFVLSSNTTWKGDYQVCMYLKDSSLNVSGPLFINFKV
jgi:hypothetical protein